MMTILCYNIIASSRCCLEKTSCYQEHWKENRCCFASAKLNEQQNHLFGIKIKKPICSVTASRLRYPECFGEVLIIFVEASVQFCNPCVKLCSIIMKLVLENEMP